MGNLTNKELKYVESVIGRLHYSVFPSEIIKWLRNFKERDRETALAILRNFEYISSDELLMRLDHLLKELFKEKNKYKNFVFIPFGKYGKSSTLISYPLSHLNRFKQRKANISFETDLIKFIEKEERTDYFVFVDDFIGSGNTFLKEYRKLHEIIVEQGYEDKVYLLAPITMKEAAIKINKEFPKLKILTEIRFKYLKSGLSPIHIQKRKEDIIRLIEKYGRKIKVSGPPQIYQPFGYNDSESMVSFFYTTPNNTFPIVWGDYEWYPLYPRTSANRLKKHMIRKKDILYLLNTFFDSELNVKDADDLISDEEDSRKEENSRRHKNNYLLLSVIYLLYQSKHLKEISNMYICNFLGITKHHLNLVYIEGKNKGYINNRYQLTSKAEKMMVKLLDKRKSKSIRSISSENMSIDNFIFLPKSFKGSS